MRSVAEPCASATAPGGASVSAHAVRAVASSKPHNADSVESLGRLAGTPLKELPASHFKGGAMTLSDRAPAGLEGDLVNLPRLGRFPQ